MGEAGNTSKESANEGLLERVPILRSYSQGGVWEMYFGPFEAFTPSSYIPAYSANLNMSSNGRNNSHLRTPLQPRHSQSEMFSNAEDVVINGGQVHNARDMLVVNINAPGSHYSMGPWFAEVSL
jgi:hypothetical protein